MRVKTLHLENFQGIADKTFAFDGKSASIYGDNGTGKTTVFNAMTWLLFDKPSTGAKNFTPKTQGPEGELHNLDHSAEVVFTRESGEQIAFRKVYHEVWKKRRGRTESEFSGHATDYYLDGVPVKEKQYTAALQDCCGGGERMKILTMPDYFAEGSTWEARRKILLELCGDISDADVMALDPELGDLGSYLRKPGTADQSYTVEEYRKIADARKREINKQLQVIPARIDEAQRSISETSASAAELDAEMARLQAEREDLQRTRSLMADGDVALLEARKRTKEAQDALEEAKTAYNIASNEANIETLDRLSECTAELAAARMQAAEAQRQAQNARTYSDEITETRAKLLDAYRQVQGWTWDADNETCRTCGQRLPADRIDTMRSDFHLRRSQRLMEINHQGKHTCSKDMIEAANKRAQDAADAASAAEQAIKDLEKRMRELRSSIKQAPAFETTDEYRSLSAKIEERKQAERAASDDAMQRASGLEERSRTLDEKIMNICQRKLQSEQSAATMERIAALENEERRLSAEYEDLDRGLYLCDRFIKSKVQMLTDRIDSKFRSVRFRLFQDQINGGVKDDCEVLIPGDGGRMVPYPFANNAARINAGLEIISILSAHWGAELPVFIDNAESVTHLADTQMQIIRLVVSEQDKDLRLVADDAD